MKEINNIVDFVSQLRICNTLIIVEGKKDKNALNSLGINNIMTLKEPIYKIVEESSAKNKKVIILTDLDKEGKELYGKLNSELQRFGVDIDNRFREFLFKNTTLREIEGIYKFIEHTSKINNI
jgi:5S rRNA maturation endonuclease (ribonuclease M5)